ncbi:MAG: hypothetical protein ACFE8A_08060 [Candidatus Hodarchaeota archaeon]
MKTKLIFISFLLFATIILGITTNNAIADDDDDDDYEVGLKEGNEYIYVCKTFDEIKMKEAWGKHYDDNKLFEDIEEGKKMKWEITEVNDEANMESTKTQAIEDAYSVKYDIWMWTDKDKFGDADYEDEEFTWFANPEDHETDKAIEDSYVPWVPTNVEDYLAHLELYKWWATDEDKLLYEKFGQELICWYNPEIHRDDVIIEMTFNEEGILSSYKVMNEDEEVVLEFALEDVMAIVIPIIVVVVIVIAALTIIYIVMRKKGIKIRKKKRGIEKNEKIKE